MPSTLLVICGVLTAGVPLPRFTREEEVYCYGFSYSADYTMNYHQVFIGLSIFFP
jgi:hypothetical protein